jgi:hypothetical protein
MVGGDAAIDLLGVVALALDDVGAGLEAGLDRLDLRLAVLERIDPVPLRRDPLDREVRCRLLSEPGSSSAPASTASRSQRRHTGRHSWNTSVPCWNCSMRRRNSSLPSRRLE